jgi:actin-related protein
MPSCVAAGFGVGVASGLNVHIGLEATDIIPFADSVVRPEAHVRVNCGTRDCITYFAEILSKDESVRRAIEDLAAESSPEGSSESHINSLFTELAEVVLREDTPRLLVPLANGQTVPVGNEKEEESEEGVFDVAKE